MNVQDTIVAFATPSGESAVALIRASGPECERLARACFALSASPTPRMAIHRAYLSMEGEPLDDVLFTWFEGPRSYTGEHCLEIACHGNPLIASRILEDLLARGCRQSEPGEFTRRAFLNGRMDLTQAEAVMELIRARSDRALAVARNQLRGAFGRKLEALKTRLLQAAATVEAYIDFPEEDLPPERREAEIEALEGVIGYCSRIVDSGKYAAFLRDGVKTVILGEPNAGKSSLLNCLLGFDRAIVSEEPGTTRDFIRERIIVDGHCIQLLDTAGLRDALGVVEREGVRKTVELAEEADLILLVVDSSRPSPTLPDSVASRLTPENCLLVRNKCDKSDDFAPSLALAPFEQVRISALLGHGMDELRRSMVERIEAYLAPGQEDLILVNARHSAALQELLACLGRAVAHLREDQAAELTASEIRGAVEAIGRILGRVDNEEMLDVLFFSFCIGK